MSDGPTRQMTPDELERHGYPRDFHEKRASSEQFMIGTRVIVHYGSFVGRAGTIVLQETEPFNHPARGRLHKVVLDESGEMNELWLYEEEMERQVVQGMAWSEEHSMYHQVPEMTVDEFFDAPSGTVADIAAEHFDAPPGLVAKLAAESHYHPFTKEQVENIYAEMAAPAEGGILHAYKQGTVDGASDTATEFVEKAIAYGESVTTHFDTANPKDALGIKKAALRLVPNALTLEAVPAMALGAKKYGAMNWRDKHVKLSVYIEAAQRHLMSYEDGEDFDPDPRYAEFGLTPSTHLGSAIACLGIIADAKAFGALIDDRVFGPAPDMLEALDTTREVTP